MSLKLNVVRSISKEVDDFRGFTVHVLNFVQLFLAIAWENFEKNESSSRITHGSNKLINLQPVSRYDSTGFDLWH